MIATDPLGLVRDRYALSTSVAVGAHAAVRGDAIVGTEPDPNGHTFAQGSVSMQLFVDRTFHGPYLEPGLLVRRMPGFDYGPDGTGPARDDDNYRIEPEVLIGWQWLYHDRFSLAAAAGVARKPSFDVPGELPYGMETYVRIGYAF